MKKNLPKKVCHHFWPSLIPLAKNTQPTQMRRGGLWAKHMGLKRGAIGNTLGNTLGT